MYDTLPARPPTALACASTYVSEGLHTCCSERVDCTAPMCSGLARHRDAVIIIGQKKHSTYDASHDAFGYLARALHSLSTHYSRFNESDLLLWHEGDFDQRDLEGLPLPPGQNARLCLLSCCSGWGPPPSVGALPYYLANVKPLQHWAPGYLHMIRFMSVTMWSHLAQLGYEYVMRLDDDSVLHSALTVDHGNIFEGMRSSGHVYGYRALAPFMPIECDALRQLGTRLPLSLLQRQPSRPPSLLRRATTTTAWSDFCGTVASVGYYNNWFVAGVRWWLTRGVLDLRRALDNSGLIYTHRLGDLVFHTAAVVTCASQGPGRSALWAREGSGSVLCQQWLPVPPHPCSLTLSGGPRSPPSTRVPFGAPTRCSPAGCYLPQRGGTSSASATSTSRSRTAAQSLAASLAAMPIRAGARQLENGGGSGRSASAMETGHGSPCRSSAPAESSSQTTSWRRRETTPSSRLAARLCAMRT